MAARTTKLKETPNAAPVGAAVIDVDYVVIGARAKPRGVVARLRRAAVQFLYLVLIAAAIGALIPPLLIAAEMAKR